MGWSNLIAFLLMQIQLSSQNAKSLTNHALNEHDYKYNMGEGYVFFEILKPEELSYTFKINPAAFSVPWNETYGEIYLVLADPICGCGALANAEDVEGQIVLIERGECSFTSKAIRAQGAGAAAAIITDNDEDNDDLYVSMVDDTTDRHVTIPTAYLLGKNGHVIRHTLLRRQLNRALIRLPLNISSVPIHQLNQPPWIVW